MAENSAPSHEAPVLTAEQAERLLRRQIRNTHAQIEAHGVMHRLLASDQHVHTALESVYEDLKDKRGEKSLSPEDFVVETQAAIRSQPSQYAPGARESYEEDLTAIDITDLIRVLFSAPGSPMSEDDAKTRTQQMDNNPEHAEITRFLRQQRLAEKDGITHEDGSIHERVTAWADSDEGRSAFNKEGVLKISKYALMAGIIAGTGGAAIPGMVAAKAAKKMDLPGHVARVGESLYGKVSNWMVNHNVVSEQKMGEINTSLKEKTQALMGSPLGKFSKMLGAVAITGGAAYLAGDIVGFDRISTAWADLTETAKNAVDLDGVAEAANESSSVPQEVAPDATEQPDDLKSDLYAPPEHFSEAEASLVHPQGGVDRDALIELIKTNPDTPALVSRFADSLMHSPEQLSMGDIHEGMMSAGIPSSSMSDSVLVSFASNQMSISPEALSYALDNPRMLTPGTIDMALQVAAPETEMAAPTPGAHTTPPDLDALARDTAAADVTTAPASVDVTIPAGSTLSEAIWQQYTDAGISITSADLYGPGEMSDHPGGLVGEIATLNGLEDPDVVAANSTITIELPAEDIGPAPGVATKVVDEVDPAAISAAVEVAEAIVDIDPADMDAAVEVAETDPAYTEVEVEVPDDMEIEGFEADGLAPAFADISHSEEAPVVAAATKTSPESAAITSAPSTPETEQSTTPPRTAPGM